VKILTPFILPALLSATPLLSLLEHADKAPYIEQYRYETKAAIEAHESLKRQYLPKIEASYRYRMVDEAGAFEAKRTGTGALSASVVLFDGFKRENALDASKASYRAREFELTHAQHQIGRHVIALYANALTLQAELDAKQFKDHQLEAEVTRLKRFRLAGTAALDEVEKMKSEQASNRYEIASIALEYERVLNDLSALTNHTVKGVEPFRLREPQHNPEKRRSDLSALDSHYEASLKHAESEASEYWPTLTLQDTYSVYDYQDIDLPTGIEMQEEQNVITLQARMTLFDFFGASKRKESAYLRVKAQEAQKRFKEREAAMELKSAMHALKTSKERINAALQRLEAAKITFESIRKKFQAGVVNNVTYLDALSAYENAKAMRSGSQFEYELQKANYYYYAGHDPKEYIQ